MAGYDPKAKRTHSPAATDRPAPVDDLLAAPAAPTTPPVARPAPTAADRPVPVTSPRVTPPAATGPDPRVLAVAAGVAVLAIVLWRRRR
jgi:hypothetical protein